MSFPNRRPKTRTNGQSTNDRTMDMNSDQTLRPMSDNRFKGQIFYHFNQTTRFRPNFYPSTNHLTHNYSIDSNINSYNFSTPNGSHLRRSYSGSSDSTFHMNKCQELSEDKIREMVTKFRPFETLNVYNRRGFDGNSFEISIMTYNILSQDLLENHLELYGHCHPSSIKWPERGHRIVRELVESNADIICLQEAHFHHFNELILPALKERGYGYEFKRKTRGKEDGCAVLYKTDKLSVEKSIELELMRSDLSSVLDRDNVALIVKLKPKLSKQNSSLIVANTHLLYNPRRGDVKIAQIRLLLAEIHKLALISNNSSNYHPIILCGDLNSEPNSLLYNFISNGSVDLNGYKIGDISGQSNGAGKGRQMEDSLLDLMGVTSDSRFRSSDNTSESDSNERMFIKHNFKLRSVYNYINRRNGEKRVISTSNQHESGLVDYIFYDYKKLKLLGFQKLMNDYEMRSIENIPNFYLGSDHLSLMAKFLMS